MIAQKVIFDFFVLKYHILPIRLFLDRFLGKKSQCPAAQNKRFPISIRNFQIRDFVKIDYYLSRIKSTH